MPVTLIAIYLLAPSLPVQSAASERDGWLQYHKGNWHGVHLLPSLL